MVVVRLAYVLGVVLGLSIPVSVHAKCSGNLMRNQTFPVGSCFLFPSALAANVTLHCSSELLYVSSCVEQGKAPLEVPLGKCLPEAGGLTTEWSCNSTVATRHVWSLTAPPPPGDIKCLDAGAGELSMSASVPADGSIDEVAFEVAEQSTGQFATIRAAVKADGTAKAVLSGLKKPGTYIVSGRAHSKDGSVGNPLFWSDVSSASAACLVSKVNDASRASSLTSSLAGIATRWLEVYRTTFSGTVPDFLQGHNAGDLEGLVLYTMMNGGPLTRYCVEMEAVTFGGVITTSIDGEARESHFANYGSCNRGKCECMCKADRLYMRLPAEQTNEMCGDSAQCNCSETSSYQTAHYVGRASVPMPFVGWPGIINGPVVVVPKGYPGPLDRDVPWGSWYSFPEAGACALGASVGQNKCTWQMSPVSYSLSSPAGTNGYNKTVQFEEIGGQRVPVLPADVAVQNAAFIKTLFDKLPGNLPPCGPPEADILAKVVLL